LERYLERCRTTRLTRTTQGCQQHRLTTCVLSRRETADATVDYVSLAVRAHTPSNRTPTAATTQKIFTTRTIVIQNSGISVSEFIGTATYSRRMAYAWVSIRNFLIIGIISNVLLVETLSPSGVTRERNTRYLTCSMKYLSADKELPHPSLLSNTVSAKWLTICQHLSPLNCNFVVFREVLMFSC